MKLGRTHNPISKSMQRIAKSERDRACALLGIERYTALVGPFMPHLRAAMQRHNCEPLVAARFVIESLREIGSESGVQRLVTYAAADLQFGALLEAAA